MLNKITIVAAARRFLSGWQARLHAVKLHVQFEGELGEAEGRSKIDIYMDTTGRWLNR